MNRTTKATLITGASQGLGRALALELGRRGTPLLLVARSRAALDDVVAAVRAGGGIAHEVAADIGDKHAIHAIAAEAAALIGPIDVLIHNASTLGPTPLPLLLDTECEDFERVLQVNLLGPFRLTKLIAGSMALRGAAAGSADRDRPTVAFISSDAAVEAYPRWGSYGVSKAAADHLARVLVTKELFEEAKVVIDSGFRASSVRPPSMVAYLCRAYQGIHRTEEASRLADELAGVERAHAEQVG